MKLVGKKGVAGLTLGEVGENAGYSRALPAHHFGNKEGLLKALAAHIRNSFSRMNLGRTPKPRAGMDAILALASLYLERSGVGDSGSKAMYAILVEATLPDSPLLADVQQLNRHTLHFLESQLRFGIEQGEINRAINPTAQAAIIIGTLRGISMQILFDPGLDLTQITAETLRNLEVCLRAPQPADPAQGFSD